MAPRVRLQAARPGLLLGLALAAAGCPGPAGSAAGVAPVASAARPLVAGISLPAEGEPRPLQGEAPARREGPVRRVWRGFSYPRALARTPQGALYVLDKTGYVRCYAADGRPLFEARTPAVADGTSSALCWHPAGRILVADSHYGRVLVYDEELRLLDAWGEHGREPGRFMLLTGIAASEDGRVYVSDQGDDVARIQVFSLAGERLGGFGRWGDQPGELKRPMNLAIQGERLAVADALNHRVQLFDLEGQWLASYGGLGERLGELKYPYGVSFVGERLWVADFGNNRLQLLDAEGGCQSWFQGAGREVGGLACPWGLLAADGRLFVTDGANDRVYELDPSALPQR